MNGFVSLKRLDGRFCGPEKKNRFDPKLRETTRNFSLKKPRVQNHCPNAGSAHTGTTVSLVLSGKKICITASLQLATRT